ncbi:hypothetical protein FHS01_005416 [Longimicrobium terrae]|uniref:Uncharacterized protein n=1 Tax=Longimicrobium terrae TaxID=1639882 RepID=A0A841H615_9BACT|nr:hypothetical protein [Longimicrobium terrae]MBB6073581.1 hypothetical protein [Longimicrobium terrae]
MAMICMPDARSASGLPRIRRERMRLGRDEARGAAIHLPRPACPSPGPDHIATRGGVGSRMGSEPGGRPL